MSEKYASGAGELIAALAKQHASPLAALRAYADCMAGMAASPAVLLMIDFRPLALTA